jgi:hypothetical protein
MEIISGKITEFNEQGMTIKACYENVDRAILRRYDKVQIGLPDGRTISPEQRKKAHALIGEIAEWQGDLPEFVKRLMKIEFITSRLQALEKSLFSLADCDVTTAREFITFLIDFILEYDIPTRVPLAELCDDINKYVYACLMHKKCAICGKPADLHHFDAIGMGRDRTLVYQIGMLVLPLCREHHTVAHQKGKKWLTGDMHLIAIPLTAEIGKKYKLTKKNLKGE